MTPATKPFNLKLPPSLPFDMVYPGATAGEGALPEHSIASRRLGVEKRLVDAAGSVTANPHLSADGQVAKWTEDTAVPCLAVLNDDLKTLMGTEVALLERGQAIIAQQLGRMPKLSDGERVALVDAFRQAHPDTKARAMAAASTGKDPMLARALSETHLLLSGLEEFQMVGLREGMLDHLPEAPNVARERAEIARRVNAVRAEIQMVENLRKAIIAQADRSKLTPAVLPRKGDMTKEQAAMFMLDFGFEAYKLLLD